MSDFHFSPRANRAAEIRWRPWGQEAFAAAKAEGKPVLLGISAVWCHWCHVMDETTYSDSSVISTINERFIPVRVDNDQRPDVNARYNMGGWPTTALLSPEGEILYGGTYIPPDAMRQVLRQIDGFYSDPANRLSLAKRIHEMKATRAARSKAPHGGELDDATARTVLNVVAADFDQQYGGFGGEQKFPHIPVLQFLLDYWQRTRDAQAQHMVQKTLHAMAEGGMYDRVFGGFFRYSTTPDFSVPHFEKMLEDLAGLLWVCSRASAMFSDDGLGKVALDVKRYLDDHLWNSQRRGYGGSQDADEHYYALDAAARAQQPEPYVDRTIYTAWNAQAALALLAGSSLLNARLSVPEWQSRGCEILEHLWTYARLSGLMCRYFDGAPHVRGLLVDQTWMLRALLAAHSATGDIRWLQRVSALLDDVEVLYDAEAESYLDRLTDDADAGRVADSTAPFEDNAMMARVLLSYAAFTGKSDLQARAKTMLRRYSQHYESYGLFAAAYASAVLDVMEPPVSAHIVGAADEPLFQQLMATALSITAPAMVVDPIQPQENSRLAALGLASDVTAAYLCRGTSCFARALTSDDLQRSLAGQGVQV